MSTPTGNPPTSTGTDNDGGRGHTAAILSAALLVAVLIAAAITWTQMHRDRTDSASTTTSSPTPTSAPDPGATGFGTPDVDPFGRRIDLPRNEFGQPLEQTGSPRQPGDPEWLTAPPAGTRDPGGWQKVAGAVVPYSTSDGPARTLDGVPVGWSHTPQGCALAAAWIGWQVNARPGDRRLRERALVSTPGELAAFDRDRAAGKIPDRAPESVTRWMLASDAFRISSWQDDLCVVRLAGRTEPDQTGGPRWLAVQATMVWDGASWRLRPPPGGQPPQEAISSLVGWTPW